MAHVVDLTEGLGDALLDVARDAYGRLTPRARRAVEWLREAAEPPPGIELVTRDGAAFTGFALLDHNKVVVLLAVRHEPVHNEKPPVVTPPPVYQRPLWGDPDERPWDRDAGPFRR